MRKNRRKRGVIMLVIGILLLAVAGGWFVVNILEDRAAGAYTDQILEKMNIPDEQDVILEDGGNSVSMVGDEAFCGRIKIEKLGVELPVYQDWNYKKLKKAPCRYSGSVDTNDMIVAAHNYNSHFGKLHALEADDVIIFVDAVGQSYRYEVKELVLLDGSAVEDMHSGEWDFTLFTCTKGGKQRVTVRCERVMD